ncbi:MAG: SRPBCC family protein [Bacteroidota bacterium]
MKVLKWILIVIAVIIAAGLLIALFLPEKVSVESQVKIGKAPAKVFHSVALFQERQSWDPWVSGDTSTTVEIIPVEGYVGSSYEWTGEKTGTGKMKIDSVEYARHITADIWFGGQPEPATVTWDFEEAGDSTLVTWGFHADAGYPMGRIFLNLMKESLEEDLDKGLANLKDHLQSSEIQLSSVSEISPAIIPEITAMVSSISGSMEEIISNMEKMFSEVMNLVNEQGLEMAGPPFCYYTEYNPEDMTSTAYCGIPVLGPGEAKGNVDVKKFISSPAIKILHTGPYEELEKSYSKLMAYTQEHNIPVNYNAWEIYINDPMEVKYPALYKTEIYFEVEKQ